MPGTRTPDGTTTIRVIWAVLTASIVLYVCVLWFIAPQIAGREAPDPIFELVFWAQSLLLAVGSLLYRRWALSDRRLRQAVAGAQHDGAGNDAAIALLNLTSVVGLALHEAIAMYGFVLAFIGGSPPAILPFAAVAIVLNALIFPRSGPLLERARRLALTPAPTV